MPILHKILSFFKYILGKRSEAKDLGIKDALLAKVVLDIHRKKIGTKFIIVPLHKIYPIHVIDRPNALESLQKRINMLRTHKLDLLEKKVLTREILAKYLPSVSWIKSVADGSGNYISFEGNGRLFALKEVFSEDDQIQLEIEEYSFKSYKKIWRRMHRVRKLNNIV